MNIVKIKTGQYGQRPMTKVRLFINKVGRQPALELFTGERCNQPHRQFRKELLPLVKIEQMIAANVKSNWSQTAGCGCGCSPGFILDVHPDKIGYQAIWVDYK